MRIYDISLRHKGFIFCPGARVGTILSLRQPSSCGTIAHNPHRLRRLPSVRFVNSTPRPQGLTHNNCVEHGCRQRCRRVGTGSGVGLSYFFTSIPFTHPSPTVQLPHRVSWVCTKLPPLPHARLIISDPFPFSREHEHQALKRSYEKTNSERGWFSLYSSPRFQADSVAP